MKTTLIIALIIGVLWVFSAALNTHRQNKELSNLLDTVEYYHVLEVVDKRPFYDYVIRHDYTQLHYAEGVTLTENDIRRIFKSRKSGKK